MHDAMFKMTNDHLSEHILRMELVVTRLSSWMASASDRLLTVN